MKSGTKIGLWSAGGLLIAAGLFFAVRALLNSGDDDNSKLSKKDKSELERLRELERSGSLTIAERQKLEELLANDPNSPNNITYIPNQGEVTYDTLGNCGFPLGNNSGGSMGCKQVAQIQLAINQKHNNNTEKYTGSTGSTWCCTGGSCDSKLMVDGTMGPCTLKAVKKYYGICCECTCTWYTACVNKVCDCSACAITKQQFNNIISGADTSDAALFAAGYGMELSSSFAGYSNVQGGGEFPPTGCCREHIACAPTQYCDKKCQCQWKEVGGRSRVTDKSYLNFNLPNYGKKYDSPLGDFYKNPLAFTNDYPKQSPLEHSYGMGKGFGFAGSSNRQIEDWSGGLNAEGGVQSYEEFVEDVP